MASLRSWRDFVLVAKPRVIKSGEVVRELVRSRNKYMYTQCFAARDFPRGRAEIKHTYTRAARGLWSRENKMADPPPETTR